MKAEMSGFSSCSELLVGLCEGRVNSKISSKCLFQNGDHSLIHACLKNAYIHVQYDAAHSCERHSTGYWHV